MRFPQRLLLQAVRTLLLAIVLAFAPAQTSALEYDVVETSLVIRSGVEREPTDDSVLPAAVCVDSPATERRSLARVSAAALSVGEERPLHSVYSRYLVNCSWLC